MFRNDAQSSDLGFRELAVSARGAVSTWFRLVCDHFVTNQVSSHITVHVVTLAGAL